MKFLSKQHLKDKAGQTCLLRINLDIKDPAKESSRITAVIPTIKLLLDNGIKIIILSHRGRPRPEDGSQINQKSEFSLKPLIDILFQKLPPIYGSLTSIDWVENLRFDPREQKNDDGFARELASRGDFYVNDDFATSHRVVASLVAITKYLPSYAGLLLEKEVVTLSRAMENPERPLVLIIGGEKIDDKVGMIKNFSERADYFLMGSAYAGIRNQESGIKDFDSKVIFPEDFIEEDGRKLDIGPKTVKKYMEIISQAKTIIWNGPLGQCEEPRYADGSKKIAEAIIESKAFSVVGGGDTQQFLAGLGRENEFSFISTGGGAMLEFLAGKKLPALDML